MTTTDIRAQLEEERRIIEAATEGPWLPVEEYGEHAVIVDEDDFGTRYVAERLRQGFDDGENDAEFIAHARTALPVRNAQVEAVLAKCDELVQPVKIGHGAEMIDLGINSAVAQVRRAIEEAGK